MSDVVLNALLDLRGSKALLKETQENRPESVHTINAILVRIGLQEDVLRFALNEAMREQRRYFDDEFKGNIFRERES